ncbi:unnamed protein product [Vitrella brassicaformis CCMP3155]|uniref:Large ribosomal subunit protein uL23m n=1 Tax=Vitrella brassicaformis (strain CCMP3155) TaxID=1169540 RepID=A0A0G4GX61_VITBC|nr:unnamed protein product [Vitrella brassicaformis CCMP3155]|mmetsp:Transcript_53476/g.134607  ORF Transcript_53476/g.134607 Transcript_53476/m.134607 type:complete len:305 (-) Transcript_53476:1152-2066(-)|eukprot:CEM35652.1 unnamed protein product [Vitrella brassicaformis CCMP3155]
MFSSRPLLGPPKAPRNVYFPWQNCYIHLTGVFLERNRLALKVPLNFTKYEIREYLKKLYGAKVLKVNTLVRQPQRTRNYMHKTLGYYRRGPLHKKAIVNFEHAIPDDVKMFSSSRQLGRNPALLKKNISYGKKNPKHQTRHRDDLFWMGVDRNAWRLPLPTLLAGDHYDLNPTGKVPEDETQMPPDPTKPFAWAGLRVRPKTKIDGAPEQAHPYLDVTPWRRNVQRLMARGTVAAKGFAPTGGGERMSELLPTLPGEEGTPPPGEATAALTDVRVEDARARYAGPQRSDRGKDVPTTGPYKPPS